MRYDINNRPTLLEEGDRVIFELKGEVHPYTVDTDFLLHESDANERIFDRLNISKNHTASEAYGYDPNGGDWPESKYRDFEALTRLVNALFDRIAALPEGETKEPATYSIENRPSLVKYGDEIVFQVGSREMKHRVIQRRLEYFDGMDRDLFDAIGIGDRFEFASKAFGYRAEEMCAPEWKDGDFEAATRLVNALFDEIADRIATKEAKPSARKFKIGDLVKLTESGAVIAKLQPGALAKITTDDGGREDGGIPYRVDFESSADEERSECHWFNADHMEPAEAAPAFNVGGWVEGIGHISGDRRVGKFLGYDSQGRGKIKDPSDPKNPWFVKHGSIKLLQPAQGEPAPARVFKIGDWVTGYSWAQEEQLTGRITNVTLSDPRQTYELGFGNWIQGDTTREAEPAPAFKPAFKIGDKVRVKADVNHPRHGWGKVKPGDVGIVAEIDSAEKIYVNFDRQNRWAAAVSEMELVKEEPTLEAIEPDEPAPLGYVTFTKEHFAALNGAVEVGKVYPLVKISNGVRFTEPLPGYSEGVAVRSALMDGTAILTDKDGKPAKKEEPTPSEDPHAKIAQFQRQIKAQAGAIARMTRKIDRQRLELRRFHELEEMRKRLPKPAPVTLDAFFSQLGIPSEFHELVREMLADLHKVRTVQVGYVAKSGEHFESGAAIGILRGGETSDALALSMLFQDSARRMIEESHI